MFVLAWQTFRASGSHGERKEGRPSFGAGAFLQLVNPKIYIYGFTAMSPKVAAYQVPDSDLLANQIISYVGRYALSSG